MRSPFAIALATTALFSSVAVASSKCHSSYDGEFQISVVKPNTKRSLSPRGSTCGQDGYLTLKLKNNQLIDSKGRIGYIASNFQFQFDNPPQENAASVGGYSVCPDNTLALSSSSVFYQCLSGSFFNLYDRSWAPQCQPILIDILPCKDYQPYPVVSQIPDGQPQAPYATPRVPVSQIPDGQPQAPNATPRVPVSQIPDGQPQAPAATPKGPVYQIPDGQPQAPAPTPKGSVYQAPDKSPIVPVTKKPSESTYAVPTDVSTTSTSIKPSITAGGNINKANLSLFTLALAVTVAGFFI